jgi:hypothetical protein
VHMERSAVNKNRCIALKGWDRLCVHAKHCQGSLGIEWDIEKLLSSGSTYHIFDLCWFVVVLWS